MTRAKLRAFAGVLLCVAAGCGGDGTDDGGAGASGGGATGGSGGSGDEYAYSACPLAERVGSFRVDALESMSPAYSSVAGEVKSGVVPSYIPDTVTTVGNCSLVRGRDLTCTPECAVGTTCDVDGACIPEPRNQDVGAVTITGLKDPVNMTARAPLLNYTALGNLQYPEFDEGDAITLSAEGGALGPFELVAEGVALLAPESSSVTVTDGLPVTVTWTPPAEPGRSHILATLNIALHGGDPVRIECDAPDTGSLEIPAELVSELLGYAFSGFPRLYLVRQTADSVELDVGCEELTVAAHHTLDVLIEGLTSCNDEHPCPDGQTCNADLFCE